GHWMFIGLRGGTGSYNMTGGTINASSRFYVGIDGGSTGSMTMTAGTIIGGAEFDVGVGGATGEFDQSGGTITLNHNGANAWVIIGQSGGNGTYNLSGGSITAADRFYVGVNANTQSLMNMTGTT